MPAAGATTTVTTVTDAMPAADPAWTESEANVRVKRELRVWGFGNDIVRASCKGTGVESRAPDPSTTSGAGLVSRTGRPSCWPSPSIGTRALASPTDRHR